MASLYFSMESEYFSFLKSWFASAFRSSDRATSDSVAAAAVTADSASSAAAAAGGDEAAFSSPDIPIGVARGKIITLPSCCREGERDDVKRFLVFIQATFFKTAEMGFRVILVLSASCVMAAVSAGGKVGELRALNHLVDRLDQSVDKLAEKERQVWFDSRE